MPDLSYVTIDEVDLCKINFSNTNLTEAKLRRGILREANLFDADLSEIDLEETDIREADLMGVTLCMGNLKNADLRETDLNEANLWRAILKGADLREACFLQAKLQEANLEAADLREAVLSSADLSGACLNEANLTGARLISSIFSKTGLNNTNFTQSSIGDTIFVNCDLSKAYGLESVSHSGPSSIGLNTLFLSKRKISTKFLKGCGVTQEIVDTLVRLTKKQAYYTCFISYSSKDKKFAERIKSDLEVSNIRCWFFPKDAEWGKDVYNNINDAIKKYDKLVVICSKNSLNSESVLREIERAIQKEKVQKEKNEATKRVLFPITIDNYLFEKWEHYLKPDILRITVGDFIKYEEPKEYQKSIERLMIALETE